MTYLVTGAAGFIGFHVCNELLKRGEFVVGVDNINDYYSPVLKEARLSLLSANSHFEFWKIDIANQNAMNELAQRNPGITHIIHLAAQAGVRYSLVNPFAYSRSNIEGHLVMLEIARNLPSCRHFVYASSSSVYGANKTLPFSTNDRVDRPVSFYAATKIAGEAMSHCYSHLFQIPITGLRFFTVYGPWGRPDMAYFIFLKAILAGDLIKVFNQGEMRRDFTYIDDVVDGILAVANRPPTLTPPNKIYNIGNHHSEPLMRFISLIELAAGVKARIELNPMQPGDVQDTFADIDELQYDVGFSPKIRIDEGIPRFVDWYRSFYSA